MQTGIRLLALALGASTFQAVRAEEGFGRLFFTPEQRQALDRQRELTAAGRSAPAAAPWPSLDGVVVRRDGQPTVWINGVPRNENEAPDGILVIPDRQHPGWLTVQPAGRPPVRARVGDTIREIEHTGERADPLDGGRVSVRKAR